MSTPQFKFFDPSVSGKLPVATAAGALDTFTDLSGHDMLLSSKTNFYFWGKNPSGGGQLVSAIWETVTAMGLTQKAVRFLPRATQSASFKLELNCECKSRMELAVGTVDYASGAYAEVGRCDINGFTKAVFSAPLSLKKNESFLLVIWQVALGDSIRVLDYALDGGTRWRNVASFE